MQNAVDFIPQVELKSVRIMMGGYELQHFPVTVININGTPIGTAKNKEEYIAIWNSNYQNRQVAFLNGGYLPFEFIARVEKGKSLNNLSGDPDTEIIDSDGENIIDTDGEKILYE